MTQRKHDSASPGGDRIREDTTRRLERAMGSLGTAAMARMDERLPWFRALSAEDRSWVGLVAQAGIAAFVEWFQHADEEGRPTPNIEFFGTAPRELKRSISLQQTVDIVRVVVEVVDERVDELAAPGGEAQLEHAVLRYTRDVAFAAAQVYAREAEVRGAWDARLEALIVDALVRGQVDDGLHSWAAALGWTSSPVVVLAGRAPDDKPEAVIDRLRDKGRRSGIDVLAGVQGDRLIVIVGGVDSASAATRQLLSRFGPGPVVIGPEVPDLHTAARSARAAVAGLRAARAWPDAPRPVFADDLLAERALDGDEDARAQLVENVYVPLAGTPLLDTLATYLEQGTSLEATARLLFVHPNTVRYRLKKITELTGYQPTEGRSAFALQVAVILGRLAEADPRDRP
ncbi:PucR C-terminal helix-turn-helix domain-containing protein [Thermostaphylospora chromogena]|uniref:PucR C-terminal helix-turn-helix domain-containing protein n=2 Tax=Thermostaphylospora chromogena TaxID=35622 RepID=A0A1H1I1E2_9ACTN|nr:PucR C-terminal helix-turn-helix domain-containing protein [Thermostaphylospora chromogena]